MIKRVFEITKRFLCDPLIRIGYLSNIGVTNIISDEKYLKIKYKLAMGKELDLNHPKTYNEKLQWLKLYDRQDAYIKMVDKYAVKEYVAGVIGSQYIIPTLGVWENFDSIEFDKLPKQFVLKCTHDSGGIVICKNKDELDIKAAKKIINKCLRRNYFWSGREWPYKKVPRRILAETYLENGIEGLHDYKIWCFNGKATYIQYIKGRISGVTYERFYDRNWNPKEFSYHNPKLKTEISRPKKLTEMLDLAESLAKNTSFLRVDLYLLNDNTVKFGELTFYPMSGFDRWHPDSIDKEFGDMINIADLI